MEKENIEWYDFKKIDFRIGTILAVEKFDEAIKKSYKIWVDFGPLGKRKTSAQITKNYKINDLIGRQIIGVLNLQDKQIANFRSEFLLLGAIDQEIQNVIILQPESKVKDGSIVA
tara:strand:- start:425 stop:769 length:345 start_codon:yes stop_codon:yes gene_type:complete